MGWGRLLGLVAPPQPFGYIAIHDNADWNYRRQPVNFTAKEDYGLRVVLDLAAQGGSTPVQAREIAHRQQIPEQFLEQLLAALRRAEVVRSTRGASGGYLLAADPARISVGTVLRALSGRLVPQSLCETSEATDEPAEASVVRGVWSDIHRGISRVADDTTFADLLERLDRDSSFMMHI
jgi:Rrf2 family cysteine metabolism transcriptional repressor